MHGFFFVEVAGRPCCLGLTPEEMRSTFFDLVAGMGAHFHFGYEEYKRMKTSELMELFGRYEKQVRK